MKILILSDSHYRNLLDIDFKKYDYVIHSGDYGNSIDILKENNVYFVKGNCDIEGLNEIFFKINDRKILVTHGHLFGVKEDYTRIMYKGLSKNADYVIFGHTHIPDMFIRDNIAFINPGSYMDGYYVEVTEHDVKFFKDLKCYKEFKRKW